MLFTIGEASVTEVTQATYEIREALVRFLTSNVDGCVVEELCIVEDS